MQLNPLYNEIAGLVSAYENCLGKMPEMARRHEIKLFNLVKNFMPSGSGVDCGTKLILEESSRERLVFGFSYHHMNENGMYDGWTEHKAIVNPSLLFKFNLKITGRDRNQIKEYLHDVFYNALETIIEHDETGYFSPERRESVKKFQEGVANGSIG